ncbi:aldehyde dehydrogenase family protein [Rhizobium sp. SYY.PMSO]|uniref:aldehyde dehydrogenase family protein n=1 Tax=Rhizobium sp. SYY.PMSO TaxID=3382192 RepID=UPI0039902381
MTDPTSGREISSLVAGDASDVDTAVAAAKLAFETTWGRFGPFERERCLALLADLVEMNADLLVELETLDVGMPLSVARHLNVHGTARCIRYMAGWPSKISGRTVDVGLPIPDSEFFGFTRKEPVGVVGAIVPWNAPLMLAAWKIAPALAAGCTIVLKPSEDACLSVLALAGLAREAGIPDGVINVVTGTGRQAGEALVRHPDVSKISFTGSTATGVMLARTAAAGLKKVSLELGGKSPQILFGDADFDWCLPLIANSIFLNSGQVCVAGSRLYVERKGLDQAIDGLTRYARSLRVGPSLAAETEIGPLINARQKSKVMGFLKQARSEGADFEDDPDIDSAGHFVRPTIVFNASQQMSIVREEVFGPVLPIVPFDDFDEAIHLANDSAFGLSSCIWTNDLRTAHRLIPRIKSGRVAVNTDPLPYPSLPEGGRKASGYGRDLGEEAIEGYLETKAVLIRSA